MSLTPARAVRSLRGWRFVQGRIEVRVAPGVDRIVAEEAVWPSLKSRNKPIALWWRPRTPVVLIWFSTGSRFIGASGPRPKLYTTGVVAFQVDPFVDQSSHWREDMRERHGGARIYPLGRSVSLEG